MTAHSADFPAEEHLTACSRQRFSVERVDPPIVEATYAPTIEHSVMAITSVGRVSCPSCGVTLAMAVTGMGENVVPGASEGRWTCSNLSPIRLAELSDQEKEQRNSWGLIFSTSHQSKSREKSRNNKGRFERPDFERLRHRQGICING